MITSDVRRWVDTMLREEYGLSQESPSPWKAALATFSAFICIGILPLLAFIYQFISSRPLEQPFLWSSVMTAVGFFTVGALKSRLWTSVGTGLGWRR